MSESSEFQQLMAQVRAGDARAAEELVRRYESEIRRTIRLRLTDTQLRRSFDSTDICQSVLANFFVQATHGQYDLQTPAELVKLLVVMVRNKVVDKARQINSAKRDHKRHDQAGAAGLDQVPQDAPTPASVVANHDLVSAIRLRLSERERYIADARGAGKTWSELSQELGIEPEALRKMFSRALERVAEELNIEDLR